MAKDNEDTVSGGTPEAGEESPRTDAAAVDIGDIDFMTFDPETAELTDDQAMSMISDVDISGGDSTGVLTRDAVETGLVSDTHPLAFGSAAWLVSHRELTSLGRGSLFLASSAVLLLAVLATLGVGLFGPAAGADSTAKIKVATFGVDASQAKQVEQSLNLTITTAKTEADLNKLIRDGKVDAGIVLKADPTGQQQPTPQVVALSSEPTELLNRLSPKAPVTLLADTGHSVKLTTATVLGFGLIFLLSILAIGGAMAATVLVERRTRVGEMVAAAIPARAVTWGKLLGAGTLALAQAVVAGGIVLLVLSIMGKQSLLTTLAPAAGWFVLLFAAGFALFGALWLIFASIASRGARITWFVVLGVVAVAGALLPTFFAFQPNQLKILSFIPFSAPAAMPLRVFNNGVDWWEPLAALVGLIILALIAILIAGGVYSRSVLTSGRKVAFKKGKAARELAAALAADKADDEGRTGEDAATKRSSHPEDVATTEADADDDVVEDTDADEVEATVVETSAEAENVDDETGDDEAGDDETVDIEAAGSDAPDEVAVENIVGEADESGAGTSAPESGAEETESGEPGPRKKP